MIFYLLSLLPIAVWGIQWCFNREISWKEAAVGVTAALLTASIFHGIEAVGVFIPSDTETWSGSVQYAQYQPRWREYYEEAIYRTETYQSGTDSKGNPIYSTRTVFDHWEPRRRWHEAEWWVETSLGQFSITKNRYNDILKEFGGMRQVAGRRTTGEHASRMIEGTPYDDVTVNVNKYVYPVTTTKKFENRLLRCKDSLYSFDPVSEEQAKRLFEWPTNNDRFDSNRLLGSAKQLWSQRSWDQMNAVLGPQKLINLIAIGFPANTSLETGMLQERYWHGGKKNDLVLCFGGDPHKPEWTYVFGWTEKQLVKRLLENRLRDGEASIEEITKIVRSEYQLLEFEEKFANIEIETPTWYYVVFFLIVGISQTIAHFVCSNNYLSKDNE
jgi:hypothetical protein